MNHAHKKAIACMLLISFMCQFSSYNVINAQTDTLDENYSKSVSNESNSSDNVDSEDETSDLSTSDSEEEESEEDSEKEALKIRDLLSEDVRTIFDSIDRKNFNDEIYKELKNIYKHFERFYFSNDEKTKLADLSVLNLLDENSVITNNKNDALRKIENISNEYLESMKNRYDPQDYQKMMEDSNLFGKHTKNTSSCKPENVVIASKYQILMDYPIVYNDNILISLNDAVSLLNKETSVEYMKENSNIVLKSNNNERGDDVIEISPGSNKIHVNDKESILNNSVINWQGNIFISTDIFNFIDENTKDGSCRTISLRSTDTSDARVIIF